MPHVLLVDFKLNEEGEVSVTEFGCGINSDFSGFDVINGGAQHQMHQDLFYVLGAKYNKVMIICDSVLAYHRWVAVLEGLSKRTKGTIPKKNGRELKKIFSFLAMNAKVTVHTRPGRVHTEGEFFHPSVLDEESQRRLKALSEQDAIVCVGSYAQRTLTFAHMVDTYLRSETNHPAHVLNSNTGVIALALNKVLYAFLDRQTPDHASFLPAELIRLSDINFAKIERMLSVSSDKIVIKPTDAGQGYGVIVVSKADLHKYLDFLNFLKTRPSNEALVVAAAELNLDIHDKSIKYWIEELGGSNLTAGSDFLLLQEFKPGKVMSRYNPTGRMEFVIQDDGAINFVNGYWKNPNFTVDEEDAFGLSKTYVSDLTQSGLFNLSNKFSKISPEDALIIKKSLMPKLQDLIKRADSVPLEVHLENMASSGDLDYQAYADILRHSFRFILPAVEVLQAPGTLGVFGASVMSNPTAAVSIEGPIT